MEQAVSLTIGGDYFAFSERPERPIRTTDFFTCVRSTLQQVAGVRNIQIDLAEEDDDWVDVPDLAELDSDYEGPHFGLVSTRFDLTLSKEEQEALLRRPSRVGQTTEFRVYLTYGWITPISCVEVRGVDGDLFVGARCVRQHLASEFERLRTGIEYRQLPGGTLRTDMILTPAPTSSTSEFTLLEHSRPAFDRYTFGYDSSRMGGFDPVEVFINLAAGGEIDLHHQANDARYQADRKWIAASEAVKELREARSTTSVSGRIKSMANSGRMINRAALLIADAAQFAESTRADLDRQSRAIYWSGHDTYLRPTVEDALNDFPEYPVDRLSEIVRLFETQRITNRELTAVAASSIGGGIIGAFLAG
jgi:hypothetical protein